MNVLLNLSGSFTPSINHTELIKVIDHGEQQAVNHVCKRAPFTVWSLPDVHEQDEGKTQIGCLWSLVLVLKGRKYEDKSPRFRTGTFSTESPLVRQEVGFNHKPRCLTVSEITGIWLVHTDRALWTPSSPGLNDLNTSGPTSAQRFFMCGFLHCIDPAHSLQRAEQHETSDADWSLTDTYVKWIIKVDPWCQSGLMHLLMGEHQSDRQLWKLFVRIRLWHQLH